MLSPFYDVVDQHIYCGRYRVADRDFVSVPRQSLVNFRLFFGGLFPWGFHLDEQTVVLTVAYR